MVRAVLKKGKVQPVDEIPETWLEGQELVIETAEPPADPGEIAAWSREIENAAAQIPDEEHRRFLAALEEHRREAKEQVRREMGLP